MKPRRNPLAKERFGEGNRQKWGMIFVAIGLVVFGVSAWNPVIAQSITPFMAYFTTLAAVLLAGATGDSMLKIWRTNPPPQPPPPEEIDE